MIIRGADTLPEQVSHQIDLKKHVILSKGIVPGLLQCATARLKSQEVIAPHVHVSMAEIFYIISGELCILLDRERCYLSSGDSVIILPGKLHGFECLVDCQFYYFNIEDNSAIAGIKP